MVTSFHCSINGNLEVQLKSDRSELLLNFFFESVALREEAGELRCQPVHLLFERLTVVLLLSNAHITTRRKDIVLLTDVVKTLHGAESFLVFQRSTAIIVEEAGNTVAIAVLISLIICSLMSF